MNNGRRARIERLEFHISYECPNNCVFCSEYDRMQEFRDHPLRMDEIKGELTRWREKGLTSVSFTGGEPGVYPQFGEVLCFSKTLGFRVGVTTNAIPFSSRLFCDRTLPYLDEVQVSVHGHTAELHNFHTRNTKSFDGVRAALDNLSSLDYPIRLTANVMATRHNLRFLPDIVRFLTSFPRMKDVLVSNVAPEGNGLSHFSEVAVRLTDLASQLPALAAACGEKGVGLKIFGVPACALGDQRIHSNDFFWDPRITVEREKRGTDIGLGVVVGYSPTRDRIKTHECDICLFRSDSLCGGVFAHYAREHGSAELKGLR